MPEINAITPVANQIKPQPAMTLADMLNIANASQQYQQAQQLNPLAVQKAQMEVEQLQKVNPYAARKAAAEATTAEFGAKDAQLKNMLMQSTNAVQGIQTLLNDKDLSAEKIVSHVKEYIGNAGGDEKAVKQALIGLPTNGTQTDLRAYLAKKLATATSAQAQLEKMYPAANMQDVGGAIVPTQAGNPLLTGNIPGATIGQVQGKTLSPQVFTTETGAPGVIGGGASNQAPQGTNIAPAIQKPVAQGGGAPKVASAGSGMQESFNAKGGLQRAPDETYDAYKARVSRLSALPTAANNALNLGNVESIPNMELTNNRILKLIEDKNVNIGPIANAIANKTGGVGLTSEQQEVMKYLEQRIRQEGARSNQDQASQSKAYGSFGTNKEALRDILYNDKALLASQRLLYKGIKNHQGNVNQPNLGAINAFENEFNNIAQNPDVMHLIGVVGNKSMEDLSTTDRQHLKKYFKGKSQEYIDSIFEEKDKLEKLVGGK